MKRSPNDEQLARMTPAQRLYMRVLSRIDGLVSTYEAYYEFKKRDAMTALLKELWEWEPEEELPDPEPMTQDEEMYCDPMYITDDPCKECNGKGWIAEENPYGCGACLGTGRIPRICGEETSEGTCDKPAGHTGQEQLAAETYAKIPWRELAVNAMVAYYCAKEGAAHTETVEQAMANIRRTLDTEPPSPELLALARAAVEAQNQPMEGTIEEWAERVAGPMVEEATAYDRQFTMKTEKDDDQ